MLRWFRTAPCNVKIEQCYYSNVSNVSPPNQAVLSSSLFVIIFSFYSILQYTTIPKGFSPKCYECKCKPRATTTSVTRCQANVVPLPAAAVGLRWFVDNESGADLGLGCGLLVPRGAERGRADDGLETLPLPVLPWEPAIYMDGTQGWT